MGVRVRGKTTARPKKAGDPTLVFEECGMWRRPEPLPRRRRKAHAVPNATCCFSRVFHGVVVSAGVQKCGARRISLQIDTMLQPVWIASPKPRPRPRSTARERPTSRSDRPLSLWARPTPACDRRAMRDPDAGPLPADRRNAGGARLAAPHPGCVQGVVRQGESHERVVVSRPWDRRRPRGSRTGPAGDRPTGHD